MGHPQVLDWSDSLWKGAMTFSGSLTGACGVGEAWTTSAENPWTWVDDTGAQPLGVGAFTSGVSQGSQGL